MRSLLLMSRFFVLALAAMTGLAASGCQAPARLDPAPLPENAFSILGEARAFVGSGSAHARRVAALPVEKLQSEVGAFQRARVLAFNARGKPTDFLELKVSSGALEWPVEQGHLYILYPEVRGTLFSTYDLLCKLRHLNLRGEIVPRLCERILCADAPIAASQLVMSVPELAGLITSEELGHDSVGGFGLGGSLCDECLPTGAIFPVRECHVVRPDPAPEAFCSANDRVIYERRTGSQTHLRIMNGNGSGDAALTSGSASETGADVDLPGQRVVFARSEGGATNLFVMNLDGTGETVVPNTEGGHDPVWSRNSPSDTVIVFTGPGSNGSAIFRICPDGTGLAQVSHPGADEEDFSPAVFDGKSVLFVRKRDGEVSRLFLQDVFDDTDEPELIASDPDANVLAPAAGHVSGENLLAFVLNFSVFAPCQIRVGRLENNGSLTVLHQFEADDPIEHNILGLDFSRNNQCLFVSAQAEEASGFPDARMEIFSCAVDGSNMHRLTSNDVLDTAPCVATQIPPP